MQNEDFIPIGFVRKVHGVYGEMRLQVREAFVDDVLKARLLFINRLGKPSPYFVASIRDAGNILVKFEGVNTPEAAKQLNGSELLMRRTDILRPAEEAEAEALPYAALLGYTIFDTDKGLVGAIDEVIDMPQQALAAVMYEDREVLIPLNEHFIQAIDHAGRRLTMELPEGLLEL
ncbi:MAG: 16S rRNA processing protein RimM [Saprospiraceae bacterium]|jgi:16S rRNA processing protein RimM|nr:16S rRNA processing protein RimM [Saprospiraceae bacterium]